MNQIPAPLKIAALFGLLVLLGFKTWNNLKEKDEFTVQSDRQRLQNDILERLRAVDDGIMASSADNKLGGPNSESNVENRQGSTSAIEERNSNTARKILLENDVQNVFGTVLSTLNLSAGDLAKLKNLLVERSQAADDARELAKEEHLQTADEVRAAIADSMKQIDQQIQSGFDAATYEKVKNILDVSSELADVRYNYSPEMDYLGCPLTGEQSLALANAIRSAYSVPMAQSQINNPNDSTAFHTQGLDPTTGLSSADRQALQLANGSLSEAQLAVLQQSLSAITTRYAFDRKVRQAN